MPSISSSYSIKPSTAAEDVTKNVLEFIHDLNFGTLIEEQFIFISGLQTKPWLLLRTHLLKLMKEDPNVKLQELVRKGFKMANLTCDSALVGSCVMPIQLVHKLSASMPQFAQFVT
ncbi:hypothetical protein ACTXT7_008000 [Hymenolepis weldensis]